MKNILLAIDFDGKEQLLIDKANEFAQLTGAKIWLLHIAMPDPEFVGYEVGPQYIRDSRAKELRKEHRLLQSYADLLKLKGTQAEGLLIEGATIEMILAESKKLKVDLIIMGHEEHGIIYQMFIGSIALQMIKKSKIPLLIVPV